MHNLPSIIIIVALAQHSLVSAQWPLAELSKIDEVTQSDPETNTVLKWHAHGKIIPVESKTITGIAVSYLALITPSKTPSSQQYTVLGFTHPNVQVHSRFSDDIIVVMLLRCSTKLPENGSVNLTFYGKKNEITVVASAAKAMIHSNSEEGQLLIVNWEDFEKELHTKFDVFNSNPKFRATDMPHAKISVIADALSYIQENKDTDSEKELKRKFKESFAFVVLSPKGDPPQSS